MAVEIRPASPEDVPIVARELGRAFATDVESQDLPDFEGVFERERSRCGYEDGVLVSTSGAFTLELAVPGGVLTTGGTTMVGVRPSHRRRGVLRQMMRALLEDGRERGESLAALWASEAGIYGRFGYGSAADALRCEIATSRSAFQRPLSARGRVRVVEQEEASEIFPRVYDTHWRGRPGHFERRAQWWQHARFADPANERGGATKFRFAVYEENGEARGYLQYRIKPGWRESGLPNGSVAVIELRGHHPDSRAALWRFALDQDLCAKLVFENGPVDVSLPYLLADPRQLVQARRDSLWVRPLDISAALQGRKYSTTARIVFALRDGFCPENEGAWELEGSPEGATCKRSSAEAEIHLDVRELGALYLGGRSARAMARAGLVRGDAAALSRMDQLFEWGPAPWCPEIF